MVGGWGRGRVASQRRDSEPGRRVQVLSHEVYSGDRG